jgi:hypothetical protein
MEEIKLTLQDQTDIYDTINCYMDNVTVYDFENEKEYIEKMERLNELLAKLWANIQGGL